MALQELRTFWMPLLTNIRLLFLMMVFTSYIVAIDGTQEMRYTTSMVPINSTEYTSSDFQSTEEYQTNVAIVNRSSIKDASLLNSSYMAPDIVFRLRGSSETSRILNTGNQFELLQLISTVSLDEQKRDISLNRFDQSTDTTTIDIIKHSSSNPKTNIEELISLDLCRQYSTCERVSNLTFKFCKCDALCILYNDCCYNADISDNSTVSNLQFDCISSIMSYSQFFVEGYQVVKTCPKDLINTEIDIKCQSDDIFLFGPWVITDSNIVFKNRFCAKCNNANVYKPFEVKFAKQKPNDTISMNNNPSTVMAALQDLYVNRAKNALVVEFIPPVAENVRQCILYNDPKNESKNCLNYYISPAIVHKTGNNEIVRNTFCSDPDLFMGCVGMFDSIDSSTLRNHDLFPLSVLFQFQQGCKGEFDVDGICLERFYEKEINVYASLVSSTNLSKSMIEEILTIMAWSFSDEISAINFRYSYSVEKIGNLFHIADVNIYGEMRVKQSKEESLNIDNQLDEAQWLIRVFPQNGFAYEVNSVGLAPVFRSYKTELSKPTVQNKLILFKANFNDNFEKKLCAKSIIECEIKSNTENPRTVIKELTCVDFIQKQPIFASTNINMNVITYTGMGFSVIALTASIYVYRRLGMHRSIPGSNVENLTIALLISDIIFMLGIGANDLSLVCYSVGVTLHYLWLLVFSFKCIALIHMCHSLTKLSLIAGDIEVGMFSKKPFFTLLGLLLPCLFVVPAVLIDLLEVQGVSVDYSGSICFPTGYPGNLIFVSAPIGFAVVINITCLLCIAVVITKQSLGIRHIRRSNSFQYFPVFVRISLVTGILWITGLLGAIIQNEAMEYLFVIFCSFQGLLIAFGNLTTKRIYRELRKRKQSLSK